MSNIKTGRILEIHDLAKELQALAPLGNKVITTSGGYAGLHIGHTRCIQASKNLTSFNFLVVIVNGDGFLMRKKGGIFMKLEERMELIAALAGIDFVTWWDDGSQTVCGALEILKPDYFTKGGDRSVAENVPEFEVCQRIGCQVVFGVGGAEKVQSSTNLIEGAKNIK